MLDRILNFINDHIFHLYWNTLRIYPKVGFWWNRGADVAIVITTKCGLHCSMCPMFITDPKYPKFDVCTLDEWKVFFQHYPQKISQVYITGGEPTLVPYLSELINWLVDRGHHVTLFSYLLKPETLYGVKKHWRFVCIPTFHTGDDIEQRYKEALDKLKGRFRIASQELEIGKKTFSFSSIKKLFTTEWFLHENHKFHFAPDSPRTGKVYLGCNKVYVDGK